MLTVLSVYLQLRPCGPFLVIGPLACYETAHRAVATTDFGIANHSSKTVRKRRRNDERYSDSFFSWSCG
jgi:hypothetical protein